MCTLARVAADASGDQAGATSAPATGLLGASSRPGPGPLDGWIGPATVALVVEALRPLASALDRWPYAVASDKDIGRLNFDSGITPSDVARARAVLAALEGK